MNKRAIIWITHLSYVFLLVFCRHQINAQQNWTLNLPSVGTFSSPRVTDLTGDGVKDIVMGAGREEFQSCDSAVIAVDGNTGKLLWQVSAKDQIFGSALFLDVNADGIDDAFVGGRSAELIAIDGAKGKVLWRFLESNQERANIRWFNFYNPQLVSDQDKDGLPDLLVANGGDVTAEAYDPNRPPGYLLVISSRTGQLIAKAEMPDGKEIYMSAVVLPAQDPAEAEIVFGTGGETIGGNLYVATLADVLSEDLSRAIRLDSSANKGFIGPPSWVDLNKDGILDIVTNAVDGRVLAFDGSTHRKLWEVTVPTSESYSSATLGYFNADDIPDVFVSFGSGVWPRLDWGIQLMINGQTGAVEFQDSLGFYQNTTPLALDLNGDGIDEILMSLNFQEIDELYRKYFYTTLLVIEFKSGEMIQIANKSEGSNLSSTPWIGDLDDNGFLDILYCHGTNLRHTYTFDHIQLHRLVTQVPVYRTVRWGAYQGSSYNGVFLPPEKK